jgi:ribonuclease BN (tRNA processing enzyme)
VAAAQAVIGALYFVHYATGQFTKEDLLPEAQMQFEGPEKLAEDFESFCFD